MAHPCHSLKLHQPHIQPIIKIRQLSKLTLTHIYFSSDSFHQWKSLVWLVQYVCHNHNSITYETGDLINMPLTIFLFSAFRSSNFSSRNKKSIIRLKTGKIKIVVIKVSKHKRLLLFFSVLHKKIIISIFLSKYTLREREKKNYYFVRFSTFIMQ